jgi:hypothetical protein
MQTSPIANPKQVALTPNTQIPLASTPVHTDSNKSDSGTQQTPTKQVRVFAISFPEFYLIADSLAVNDGWFVALGRMQLPIDMSI